MFRWICSLFFCIGLQAQSVKTFDHTCADGKVRPYVVYSPQGESKAPKPLLVFLHGAISSPELKAHPEEYVQKSPLLSLANTADCYVLFPFGQQGATWFDHVGQQMVMDEIAQVKKQYAIDPNKVFLSGFSDGGSGVYYFVMTQPEPFAGFIAMNGSLKVASMLGEEALFPCNMNQKPLYILNTTEDILYPLDQIIPAVDFLKRDNPHIVFRTPKGNHFLSYLPEEQTSLVTFIKENTRKPLTHIVWETANISKINSIGWLRLSALSLDQAPASWHVPYPKVRIENNKADLGLKYDYTYQGKGLKVAGFKNDTVTAKRLGVKQGDILLSLGRDSITSPMSPMLYTAKKKAGDPTQMRVLREGTPLTLKGNFNAGYPYLLLKQPEKTAKIEAELIGRRVYIRTSRVADYQADRAQAPVKIKVKIKNLNK